MSLSSIVCFHCLPVSHVPSSDASPVSASLINNTYPNRTIPSHPLAIPTDYTQGPIPLLSILARSNSSSFHPCHIPIFSIPARSHSSLLPPQLGPITRASLHTTTTFHFASQLFSLSNSLLHPSHSLLSLHAIPPFPSLYDVQYPIFFLSLLTLAFLSLSHLSFILSHRCLNILCYSLHPIHSLQIPSHLSIINQFCHFFPFLTTPFHFSITQYFFLSMPSYSSIFPQSYIFISARHINCTYSFSAVQSLPTPQLFQSIYITSHSPFLFFPSLSDSTPLSISTRSHSTSLPLSQSCPIPHFFPCMILFLPIQFLHSHFILCIQ